MVDLAGEYDEQAKPSSNNFDPLPAGDYVAELVNVDREPISKANDKGDCLAMTWKVRDGEFAGRLFWQRINLWWDAPEKTPGKVREIANAEFAAIREATGIKMPKSTDEILERACLVRLKTKADPGYNPRNEVVSVKPVGGAPARAGAAPAARSAPAAAARPAQSAGGTQTAFQRAKAQREAAAQPEYSDGIPY